MTKRSKINSDTQLKLAVFIDADNSPAAIAEGLLEEIAKYGIASIKKIYGDWTMPHLNGWKKILLELGLQPVQQFAYTQGKNATDSALIIEAMDILYTANIDGFCIISSDSDFTPLAQRLRQSGKLVIGFGEKKTPRAFMAACDKFIYTEILRDDAEVVVRPKAASKARRATDKQNEVTQSDSNEKVTSGANVSDDKSLEKLLRSAVEQTADDTGWAILARIGAHIAKRQPEFDARNYGYKKLGDLIRDFDFLEVVERETPNSELKRMYVRVKE